MDRFDNNERMEFKGDRYLKGVHGRVLSDKYPELDQETLTWAFQQLIKEKTYAEEAERLGFFDYILMSDDVKTQALHWKKGEIEKVDMKVVNKYWRASKRVNIYLKLLEDAYEAFGCALVEAVDNYTDSLFGPGMGMLFRWAAPIMNNLKFDPTKKEETKHPVMRLKELWEVIYSKELYESKRQGGRPIKFSNDGKYAIFRIDYKRKSQGYIPIEAVDPMLPYNDREKVIAKTHGETEQDARKKAAEIALKNLYKWRKKDIDRGLKGKQEVAEALAQSRK